MLSHPIPAFPELIGSNAGVGGNGFKWGACGQYRCSAV